MKHPQLKSPNEAIPHMAALFKENKLVPWSMIVQEINKHYEVRNWMVVRAGLQAMINADIVKRTNDVVNEEYILKNRRQ